ncbi:FRG domain-containing protein [Stenotrophomonas maltophilia]|uniref:FRG domain-containing protein n=1 Tax=Stenotrophomonas maltophilia group TaxID=995085 RepID=UPI0009B3B42C|nr:FRG domain-containing protein [Stenotrophomonas maltophilia]NNH48256.1 FRG domain-containing protein [Stenotrophomonas maltophilia]VEE53293.1 FRG domain [Stenotrophomonas maltophilia]
MSAKEIEINSLSELMSSVEEWLAQSTGPRWFRGSGNHPVYELVPSLMRHPDVVADPSNALTFELRLKSRFLQTSAPFLKSTPATDFDWLFLQQHYGVPTRLLDWTENPYIALYFALSSSRPEADACVWMLDPVAWNKRALNNERLDRVPDPTMPQAAEFLKDPGGDFAPSDPIAILGNHTNSRITAQRGNFVMFCRSTESMEKKAYAEDSLVCLKVPAARKQFLHGNLLRIGYTHSVVYPDLSGLGTEIKTTFGFQ